MSFKNFLNNFFQLYWDIIDILHCISLGRQHNYLTYIYCETMTTVSLVNIHHHIDTKKRKKCFFKTLVSDHLQHSSLFWVPSSVSWTSSTGGGSLNSPCPWRYQALTELRCFLYSQHGAGPQLVLSRKTTLIPFPRLFQSVSSFFPLCSQWTWAYCCPLVIIPNGNDDVTSL